MADISQLAGTAAPQHAETPGADALLSVRHLEVRFRTNGTVVRAVNGISYEVEPGEHVGIVGESGSGKSASALALQGLVGKRGDVTGKIHFEGRDILRLSPRAMREVRGRGIGMIYQDPFTSLNPVLTIGRQIGEALRRAEALSRGELRARTAELLNLVGIPDSIERMSAYPHHLSGGMRQRVMLAMAVAAEPRLLIADEPTTALDVTIQAQILDLLRQITDERGMALLLITHDLGVVAGLAYRVNVMYAGRIVESAPTEVLFARPSHPYTLGLLQSLPQVHTRLPRLATIEGQPPDMTRPIRGCPFAPRCPRRVARCEQEDPPLMTVDLARQSEAKRLSMERIRALGGDAVPSATTPQMTACWNPPGDERPEGQR